MRSDIAIFLGPTLPPEDAQQLLDCIYLPPARQGSVYKAVVELRPTVIGLIDGVFAHQPAVRHKEILWAMAAGIHVYGCSSMGALRSAELAPFGMQGFGFLHRWFCLTAGADDSDVAVAMAPPELGSTALGDALVNIRLSLKKARRSGVIGAQTCQLLDELARDLYFTERSYASLIAAARGRASSSLHAELDVLERWLVTHCVDQKRQDAVGLLKHLAVFDHRPLAPRPGFVMTESWAADLDAASLWEDYQVRGRLFLRSR